MIESILFNHAFDSFGRFDADVVMFAVVVLVCRQFFLDKFGIVKENKSRVHHLFDRPNLQKRGLAMKFFIVFLSFELGEVIRPGRQ